MSADQGQWTREKLTDLFKEVAGITVEEALEKYGIPERQHRKQAMSQILATEDNRTGEVVLSPEEPRGKRLALFMMCLASDLDPVKATQNAKQAYDKADKTAKADLDDVIKSLEASTGSAGGVFVPEDLRAELIPLLRANNVVRASGAVVIPMPFGNASMNLQASTATSAYYDELQAVVPSQPGFGRLKLLAKKLMTLVPISNDLIRFGMSGFAAMIRDDIVQSMGNREDLAFIRDDGSVNTPKGLRHAADAANVNASTGTTVAQVTTDLALAVQRLEDNNIPLRRPGWLFTPRTKWFLMAQRGTDDQHIWREEIRMGTIFGFPFRTTTAIPNNLGGGGDESEIYFADFSSIVIGDAVGMEIQEFDGVAYDDSGTIIAGVNTDERVLRGISEHDMVARQRGKEISVITEVDWILS